MPDRQALKSAGRGLLTRIQDVMDRVDWESFMELGRMLPRARRTFVTGAGRSGLVAKSFGMRLMHAGLPSFVPGETVTPAAGAGDLLVAVSCTGETGYTSYLAGRAREPQFSARKPGDVGDRLAHFRLPAYGEHHCRAARPDPGNGLVKLLPGLDIQTVVRVVKDQDTRCSGQRPAEDGLADLPRGEKPEAAVPDVRNAELVHERGNLVLFAGRVRAAPDERLHRGAGVRGAVQEPALIGVPFSADQPELFLEREDVNVARRIQVGGEGDRAGGRGANAGDELGQHGLARPVPAQECPQLTRMDAQRDRVEDLPYPDSDCRHGEAYQR